MPKITTKTLGKIAKLSKLSIGQDIELDNKIMAKVNTVLDLSDDLQSLDTAGVNLFDGWRKNHLENLREDEPNPNQVNYQRIRSNIINSFPSSKDDLLVVEGIFENS